MAKGNAWSVFICGNVSLGYPRPSAPSEHGQYLRTISVKFTGVRKVLIPGTVANFYRLIESGHLTQALFLGKPSRAAQ